MTTATESVDRANAVIRAFGERSREFFRRERRDQLDSVLFDVPRRSLLGWDGIYQHGPDFLRRLSDHATPEEIGTRMRYLGRRPYQLQLSILALGYLGAREQRRLDLGLSAGERLPGEDVDATVDFLLTWERIQRSYRDDGTLLPEEASGATRIVTDDLVDEVSDLLVLVDQAPVEAIRRATATVNAYAFLVHGEQRDGTFGHGPYVRSDASTIFFRETTDLQNDYLPWAAPGNPYSNVVIAYACRDADITCDTYGTLVTQPYDLTDRLTHVVALTVDSNDGLHRLDDAALQSVQESAAKGVKSMYAQMARWEPSYKLDYGRPLFANHLKTFVDLLDLGSEWGEELLDTFDSLKSDLIDRLFVEEALPSVWAHMVHGKSDCFSPIVL
jgi:hypothetical protein